MKCIYNATFTCFRSTECRHRRFIDCLQAGIMEFALKEHTYDVKRIRRDNANRAKVQYWKSKYNEACLTIKELKGSKPVPSPNLIKETDDVA